MALSFLVDTRPLDVARPPVTSRPFRSWWNTSTKRFAGGATSGGLHPRRSATARWWPFDTWCFKRDERRTPIVRRPMPASSHARQTHSSRPPCSVCHSHVFSHDGTLSSQWSGCKGNWRAHCSQHFKYTSHQHASSRHWRTWLCNTRKASAIEWLQAKIDMAQDAPAAEQVCNRLAWRRGKPQRCARRMWVHGVGASPNAAHAECVRTQIETLNGRRWCRTHRSLPQHCAASGLAPTLAMSSAREWRRGLPQRWL